jgi:nitrogen fixation NifU-like protein
MSNLRELYQEMILDHGKKPRNFRALPGANRKAEGFNPLCGDRLTLWLQVEGGVVRDAAFEGRGCAISTASASLMTDTLKGRTEADAQALFEGFRRLVTGERAAPGGPALEKLEVFSGVSEFPLRVKCATLCWHTMRAALENRVDPVTTE